MKRLLIVLPLVFICAVFAAGCGIEEGKVVSTDFVPTHMEDYEDEVYDGQDCGYSYGMNPSSGDYENYYHCEDRYRTVIRQRRVPDKWFVTIEACKADDASDCDSKKVEVSEKVYNEVDKGDIYNRKSGKIIQQ